MASTPTKLQRWLDLVAYLASRRFPVSTDQLWAAVPAYVKGLDGDDKDKAAVRRMFERDKDELRALGIPIDTVTFQVMGEEESHGYRIPRADFHLPYLKLVEEAGGDPAGPTAAPPETGIAPTPRASDSTFELRPDEAGAALDGLRELAAIPAFPLRREARSAFRKLAFDLDPSLAASPELVYVEDPETVATAHILSRLSDALLVRKAVTFDYHAMHRDVEARRTVHPLGLLFQHGRWYLVADDPDRTEPRMFRVGRMGDLEVNSARPGTPDYAVPDDFDLSAYGGRSAWELGEDPEGAADATVLFRFPRSIWAHRNGHGSLVEEREDGSQLRRFQVRRRDPFLRWLLSLGGDAEVVDPEELREDFRDMVRAVARQYGPEEGRDG